MGRLTGAENYVLKKSDSNFLIALFAVIYFTSQIILGTIFHKIGTLQAFMLQTTLSSGNFKDIASGWIASGQIGIYYQHFYLDYFHPLWYSIFLSLMVARAFKMNHVNPKFNGVVLTPFIAGLCDIFENTMHIYFLSDLDRATPVLVAMSGLATNTKWILSLSVTALVIVLTAYRVIKRSIIK